MWTTECTHRMDVQVGGQSAEQRTMPRAQTASLGECTWAAVNYDVLPPLVARCTRRLILTTDIHKGHCKPSLMTESQLLLNSHFTGEHGSASNTKTALAWGSHQLHFDLWSRLLSSTFNPRRAMVMTHTHAKGQGQRWLVSKNGMETDGQMDGGDCISWVANAVGKHLGRNLATYQQFKVLAGISNDMKLPTKLSRS